MTDAPLLSRREKRKVEIRSRILRTSATLFGDKGFESSTINDICDAADVSRRTLYQYFPGKQELIRALWDSEFISQTLLDIGAAIEHSDELDKRIHYLFRTMRQGLQHAGPLERELARQFFSGYGSRTEHEANQHIKIVDMLEKLFKTAKSKKRLHSYLTPRLSAELLRSVMAMTPMLWIDDPDYPIIKNTQKLEKFLCDLAKDH